MRVFLFLLAVVVATLVLLGTVVVPHPLPLRSENPGETAYMAHRMASAREAGESFELHHRWVPLERISPHLQRAVIVAEDHRFREHGGVDWEAVAEELGYGGEIPPDWRNAEDRRAVLASVRYYREHVADLRGRSTITQQLARNLYLSPNRSTARKVRELLIAYRLERHLSKDRILELYLNLAEWGPGIFGAEAASQVYFGRSASDLTLSQAATLTATLPHPLTSNPQRNPAQMNWRRDIILNRLTGGPGAVADGPLIPRER